MAKPLGWGKKRGPLRNLLNATGKRAGVGGCGNRHTGYRGGGGKGKASKIEGKHRNFEQKLQATEEGMGVRSGEGLITENSARSSGWRKGWTGEMLGREMASADCAQMWTEKRSEYEKRIETPVGRSDGKGTRLGQGPRKKNLTQ